MSSEKDGLEHPHNEERHLTLIERYQKITLGEAFDLTLESMDAVTAPAAFLILVFEIASNFNDSADDDLVELPFLYGVAILSSAVFGITFFILEMLRLFQQGKNRHLLHYFSEILKNFITRPCTIYYYALFFSTWLVVIFRTDVLRHIYPEFGYDDKSKIHLLVFRIIICLIPLFPLAINFFIDNYFLYVHYKYGEKPEDLPRLKLLRDMIFNFIFLGGLVYELKSSHYATVWSFLLGQLIFPLSIAVGLSYTAWASYQVSDLIKAFEQHESPRANLQIIIWKINLALRNIQRTMPAAVASALLTVFVNLLAEYQEVAHEIEPDLKWFPPMPLSFSVVALVIPVSFLLMKFIPQKIVLPVIAIFKNIKLGFSRQSNKEDETELLEQGIESLGQEQTEGVLDREDLDTLERMLGLIRAKQEGKDFEGEIPAGEDGIVLSNKFGIFYNNLLQKNSSTMEIRHRNTAVNDTNSEGEAISNNYF